MHRKRERGLWNDDMFSMYSMDDDAPRKTRKARRYRDDDGYDMGDATRDMMGVIAFGTMAKIGVSILK